MFRESADVRCFESPSTSDVILSAKSEEMVKWVFAVADELEKFSVRRYGRKNGLGADSEEDKVIRLPIQKSADVRRKCQVGRVGAF